MKKPRKTLGQIAYEASNKLNKFVPPWDQSGHQAEYEAMALAVAKEVLRRARETDTMTSTLRLEYLK